MGINLSVRKVTGKTMCETWGGKTVSFYNTETQEWFSCLRHAGDRDFILNNDFEFIDNDNECEDQELARPKDFNECRYWIMKNVCEANQQRLLGALDKIEQDKSLCFKWSW